MSAQTDDIDDQCNECEYPANDIWELGEHIYEFHTIKTFGKFVCHFCDERFGGKSDLAIGFGKLLIPNRRHFFLS